MTFAEMNQKYDEQIERNFDTLEMLEHIESEYEQNLIMAYRVSKKKGKYVRNIPERIKFDIDKEYQAMKQWYMKELITGQKLSTQTDEMRMGKIILIGDMVRGSENNL